MEITIEEVIDGVIAMIALFALISFFTMVLYLPIESFLGRLV